MAATLRAMILGSGFAGQGHAEALRDCGVEIVAMASRTEAVVRRVAAEMDIPLASTDWRTTLAETHPDIVAVGTPGGTHLEMVGAAVAAGCHVYCDKPLATTAEESRQLYAQARDAGVKTAYAASFRYQPAALWAKQLVAEGAVGPVREVECVSHYNWPRLTSFGWSHRLATGGGRLNNNFTHKLAITLNVLGGRVLAATGETRNDLRRVPVGEHVHDFREFTKSALTPEQAAECEWRDVDSDWSYTVLTRIGEAGSDPAEAISATFRHSALWPGMQGDYIAFYGEEGVIHIKGAYVQGQVYVRGTDGDWQERPVPAAIRQSLPQIKNDAQRNWTALARDFVHDIRGEEHGDYLTFRDGWLFQEVIDIVRQGSGYTRLPEDA